MTSIYRKEYNEQKTLILYFNIVVQYIMSIRKTQQQKISSLRRKDSMWIYKNPQGLQILEDVITVSILNEIWTVELIDLLFTIGTERKKKKAICEIQKKSSNVR